MVSFRKRLLGNGLKVFIVDCMNDCVFNSVVMIELFVVEIEIVICRLLVVFDVFESVVEWCCDVDCDENEFVVCI